MIDDTPEVKWSTAWWTMWGLGVWGALLCLVMAIYGFVSQQSLGLVGQRYEIWLYPISGRNALWMSGGYLGLAIAAFAYGYCRYSIRLDPLYEPLLALGLVIALVGIVACSSGPILGYF